MRQIAQLGFCLLGVSLLCGFAPALPAPSPLLKAPQLPVPRPLQPPSTLKQLVAEILRALPAPVPAAPPNVSGQRTLAACA